MDKYGISPREVATKHGSIARALPLAADSIKRMSPLKIINAIAVTPAGASGLVSLAAAHESRAPNPGLNELLRWGILTRSSCANSRFIYFFSFRGVVSITNTLVQGLLFGFGGSALNFMHAHGRSPLAETTTG